MTVNELIKSLGIFPQKSKVYIDNDKLVIGKNWVIALDKKPGKEEGKPDENL